MAVGKASDGSTIGKSSRSRTAKPGAGSAGRSATALYVYLERTLKSDRMRRTLHDGAVNYENETGLVETAAEEVGGRRA